MVRVCPCVPVPLIAGNAAFDGAGVGAAPTTTSRFMFAARLPASVTVSVTYLVPPPWKVKSSVWPVPSGQLPPEGGLSAQVYEHGAFEQLEPLASKCTTWPVTGLLGENVNAADGGAAATTAVAAELADADPPDLVAVTTARIVCPTSPAASV